MVSSICGTSIALLLACLTCFLGYRLLPYWMPGLAYFVGFALGAQALQAFFEIGFLATPASWITGLLTGIIAGLLCYLYPRLGFVILAGALGYGLATGLMALFGLDYHLVTFLTGVAAAIATARIMLHYKMQKYVSIVATSLAGAFAAVFALILGIQDVPTPVTLDNPLRFLLLDDPVWTVLFLVLAIAGSVFQLAINWRYTLELPPNRIW
jgi:hypothetical protein